MNLLINSEIALPPTQSLALRFTTLLAKNQLKLSILYEVLKKDRDYYYSFLKSRGLMDFAEDLVFREDRECGIRIDTEYNFPLTIVKKEITFQSIHSIMNQLKVLEKISRQ